MLKVEALEEGNVVEREFKFLPFGPLDEDSLNVFRPALAVGMFIELHTTVAALHLYLDTEDRFLLANGGSLRIQNRRKRKKCKVVFKPNRAPGGIAMVRPETWTIYRSREVLDDLRAAEPVGCAFKRLRSFCHRKGRTMAEFEGVVWVQSFRRIYIVWSDQKDGSIPLPFAAIVLEDVYGNALHVSLDEMVPSFRYRVDEPIRQVTYRLGEIEAIGQHMEHAAEATDFLESLQSAAASHPNCEFDLQNKYERVMSQLVHK